MFKKIYIEITNVCNKNCEFCPGTSRPKQFMSLSLFEKILEQTHVYTNHIYLHVLGEPLMHSELEKILDISHEYGVSVNITTNGLLIASAGKILERKKSVRQINFSLHSFDGSDDNYLKNIFSFIRSTPNIFNCLRIWSVKNKNLSPCQANILEAIETEYGVKIESSLTSGNGITLKKNVFLQIERQFEWPIETAGEASLNSSRTCRALKDHIAVLADGTVVPCCLDSEGVMALGNINNSSFESIINSEQAKNILEGFSRGKRIEDFCKTCRF